MLIASAFLTFTSCNGQTAGCCGSKSKSCSHSCSSKKNALVDSTTTTESELKIFQGSYEEVLSLAKIENKKIFIDAYAVWCGPCKMLDKNTLTNQTVIELLNKEFIVFKFDAEKGEGKILAEKFMIKEYPTLMVLDSNGKLVSKSIGYKNAEELIKWLNIK
jgi:thiol:disulfide interchange protein